MPLNPDLHKVMIIGSGPIVIGQAAEFDYAGSQACRALKDAGLEVVLVNPNPATIMTDHSSADHIYIEPLTLETLRRIILKEKPDSLLSTLGGQSGLTLSMQLAKEGFLEQHGVKLLGAKCETIEKAEDRQQFKDTMLAIRQPVIPSEVVDDGGGCARVCQDHRLPRDRAPGVYAGRYRRRHLPRRKATARKSPRMVCACRRLRRFWSRSAFPAGRKSNSRSCATSSATSLPSARWRTSTPSACIPATPSSLRPALTLADKEYQMLRRAALDIITALGSRGRLQRASSRSIPIAFDYAVIEVNPRVQPFLRPCVEGDRLPDCQVRRADCHRLYAGRNEERRDGQDLRLRSSRRWTTSWRKSRSGPLTSSCTRQAHPRHADEGDRRSHGDWHELRAGADEGGSRRGNRHGQPREADANASPSKSLEA